MDARKDHQTDLTPLLGPPVRSGEEGLLRQVADEWGVEFPEDFLRIAGAYGDVAVSGYIFLCGARNVRSYGEGMGKLVMESDTVPCPVLPSPGGALIWGNTIEGDQLFLVDRGEGRWTVSAFRRGWADWHDTDLEFGPWFRGVLAGEMETDWMPEWEDPPHLLQLDGGAPWHPRPRGPEGAVRRTGDGVGRPARTSGRPVGHVCRRTGVRP